MSTCLEWAGNTGGLGGSQVPAFSERSSRAGEARGTPASRSRAARVAVALEKCDA